MEEEEECLGAQSIPYHKAIENNCVIFVPNQDDKIPFAAALINHFSDSSDISERQLIKIGGKRVFFLVQENCDVTKTVEDLQLIVNHSVFGLREDALDNLEKCLEDIDRNHVLVLTGDVFLELLQNEVIETNNVYLLIGDECHNATNRFNAFRMILQEYKDSDSESTRIVGLTKTLVNEFSPLTDVLTEAIELMGTLFPSFTSTSNEDVFRLYGSKSNNNGVVYHIDRRHEGIEHILGIVRNLPLFLDTARRDLNGYSKLTERIISARQGVASVCDAIHELGIKGAYIAALVVKKNLDVDIWDSEENRDVLSLAESMVSQLLQFRKAIEETINPDLGLAHLKATASDKLNSLLKYLYLVTPEDATIIFVRNPVIMVALYHLLQEYTLVDPALVHFKIGFINLKHVEGQENSRKAYFAEKNSAKVLSQFNRGEINVVIGCGLENRSFDSKRCKFVFAFDAPRNFIEFSQMKSWCQSSGSKFLILTESQYSPFVREYSQYRTIGRSLKEILLDDDLQMMDLTFKPLATLDRQLKSLNVADQWELQVEFGDNSYHLLNRYLKTLKYNDSYVKSKDLLYWRYFVVKGKTLCYMRLPMEADCFTIEGKWCDNLKEAKKSMTEEACKQLIRKGHLSKTTYEPVIDQTAKAVNSLIPDRGTGASGTIDEAQEGIPESRVSTEKKVPECLTHCEPKAGEDIFLHVLQVTPLFIPDQDNHRMVKYHEMISSLHSFAILSSKMLPDLAKFRLFLNAGEVEVGLRIGQKISLDEQELERLKSFHFLLFDKLLIVAKPFLLMSGEMSKCNYLVVPVKMECDAWTVDWAAVGEAREPEPLLPPPSDEQRAATHVTDESHDGRLLSAWYRPEPVQKYLVTKICYDMSIQSAFPEERYGSYENYFLEKYGLEALSPDQPLLEVRPLSSSVNYIKPRSMSKIQKWKQKQEKEECDVVLFPEFCRVWPVSGRYWLKAVLLPSALHRISQLYAVHELRSVIATETGVGKVSPGNDAQVWDKLTEEMNVCKTGPKNDRPQDLTPLEFEVNVGLPLDPWWGREEEPLDPDLHLMNISYFELGSYALFVKKPLRPTRQLPAPVVVEDLVAPPLTAIQPTQFGPQLVTLLQAVTLNCANDCMSNDRLAILGDAYIKYALSLGLYIYEPGLKFREDLLTVRSVLMDNKNLFQCGKSRGINSLLEVQEFSPAEEWLPPAFCVESRVANVISSVNISPKCLFDVTIPDAERFSGRISERTHSVFEDVLLNSEDCESIQSNAFLNLLVFDREQAASAVKAVVGAYLQEGGIKAALSTMNWFEVADVDLTPPDLFDSGKTCEEKQAVNYLWDCKHIENVFQYSFKNPDHVLEAVTHPTYLLNNATGYNGRLDFLGEAVIDMAVTAHLHSALASGRTAQDVRRARWALGESAVAAAAAVAGGIHKCLHAWSPPLVRRMAQFNLARHNHGHPTNYNLLLMTEDLDFDVNSDEAITADVPSPIANIFRSVVGAIFLDCGFDLDIVWKSIYPLLKPAIDEFTKNIPKIHTERLEEIGGCYWIVEDEAVTNLRHKASLHTNINNDMEVFIGYGSTKEKAQQAAAKMALRKIEQMPDSI